MPKKLCSKCGGIDLCSPCHRCKKLAQQARDRQRDPIRRMQRDGHARTTLARQTKKRDNYTCQRCRRQGPPRNPNGPQLFANHIIPLAYGGPNVLANMQTLCQPCHEQYHHALNAAIQNAKKTGTPLVLESPAGRVVFQPPAPKRVDPWRR